MSVLGFFRKRPAAEWVRDGSFHRIELGPLRLTVVEAPATASGGLIRRASFRVSFAGVWHRETYDNLEMAKACALVWAREVVASVERDAKVAA